MQRRAFLATTLAASAGSPLLAVMGKDNDKASWDAAAEVLQRATALRTDEAL
jgi:integral membrane sensor domain MASE1